MNFKIVITVDDDIFLSEITPDDKPSLIEYLNNKEIYRNTLLIPYPYTKEDADAWISQVERDFQKRGKLYNYAIRKKDSELIGGFSFQCKYGINSSSDEIGFWLAKPFRNKGIMTKVVKKMCEFGFYEFKLTRIEAVVFDFNLASSRVLEKAGFSFEGLMKNSIEKDNNIFNGKFYVRLNIA